MALEHIHIQGKFEGYFRPDNAKPVLGATFNELDWRFFAVDEYQIIPEYYPDEQKVHDFEQKVCNFEQKVSDLEQKFRYLEQKVPDLKQNFVMRK